MNDKYVMLVESLEELLKHKNEVLLKGYNVKPLIDKIKKAETK